MKTYTYYTSFYTIPGAPYSERYVEADSVDEAKQRIIKDFGGDVEFRDVLQCNNIDYRIPIIKAIAATIEGE